MKTVLIAVEDTLCICNNCKKEFTILKENLLDDYRQCTHCGSLRWKYKWEWELKQQKKTSKTPEYLFMEWMWKEWEKTLNETI